jgi:hypothetical protein
LATKRAIFAEELLMKQRYLANQPMPEVKQSEAAGEIWAKELIRAGIPPRLWDEIFTLAHESRPASSIAFMINADQVILAWKHFLHGHKWDFREETWKECDRVIINYCGECDKGEVRREVITERYGKRFAYDKCYCFIAPHARNSYPFRRFCAAFEIRYNTRYKRSKDELKDDLISLYHSRIDDSLWDSMVDRYISEADNPTVKGLCKYLRSVGGER